MDIDPRWWETASFEGRWVSAFLAERDISAVLRFLRTRGFSRARLAAMTGLSETRVRQISQGRQRVTSYEVLERIADGLGVHRPCLGLADVPRSGEINSGRTGRDSGGFADPMLHASWTDLLGVLAARSNTVVVQTFGGRRRASPGSSPPRGWRQAVQNARG